MTPVLAPRARTIVREHRRRLLRDCGGRVLDLSGDPEHRALYPVSAEVVTRAPADGDAFDHVVSVFHLCSVPDARAEIERVKGLLGPDVELVFLEPVVDPGWTGRGQRLVAPLVGRVAGWRSDRDIVALLRDARLVMSTVTRTPMPRYLWPLTELVEGRAERREQDR
jgi:SAM-dependent methyltransferase